MGEKKLLDFIAFAALILLFSVVVVHLRFVILPVSFLALGFLSTLWSGRKALLLFLFLLPLINSTPDIFYNGYPFNYMGISLFYLAGIMIASRLKKEKAEFVFPGYGFYHLFLLLIVVSVFFLFLRWSNVTVSLRSFLRDTPVAPSGERISFAAIFPAITLALFSLTPFLAAAIRHWRLTEKDVFTPLKAGFCLSFFLAMAQKWLDPDFLAQGWWGLKMNQVNGGFSDFNAFGFFAGAMFFYQAMRLTEKLPRCKSPTGDSAGAVPASRPGVEWHEILFLGIALAAIFISGCRTAFLFVLLAVGYLIFSRKTGLRVKALVVLLLFVALLVAGGTLKKRLQDSLVQTALMSDTEDWFRVANGVSSGRLAMLVNSARMIGRFPVEGVGAGNFLFYLKYLRFAENAYLDLPLNQYLLILSETGFAGGLLFILFLAASLKGQQSGLRRSVIGAIAFALLFNNFFWFPECLLLFWIFLAGGDAAAGPERKLKPVFWCTAVLVFSVFHWLDFHALQPLTWNREKRVAYEYGFWLPEKNERGRFSWTRGAAGIYVSPDVARDFAIVCEAPQGWLQKEPMVVTFFWRGRFWQQVVFSKNHRKEFRLPPGPGGFLEIRVHPTFNLQALKLGVDARELGVQFSMPAPALP
jgi:hypothetical protein